MRYAYALVLVVLIGCNLELLNEQDQGPTESTPIVEPSPEPSPSSAFDLIREVVVEKNIIGNCGSDRDKISAGCVDPALLTCRARDAQGNDLTDGLVPSWSSQAPITIAAANVNRWNARGVCDRVGETGSVICIVTDIATTRQLSDEEFYLCVQ